jgi:hypothetical protein
MPFARASARRASTRRILAVLVVTLIIASLYFPLHTTLAASSLTAQRTSLVCLRILRTNRALHATAPRIQNSFQLSAQTFAPVVKARLDGLYGAAKSRGYISLRAVIKGNEEQRNSQPLGQPRQRFLLSACSRGVSAGSTNTSLARLDCSSAASGNGTNSGRRERQRRRLMARCDPIT